MNSKELKIHKFEDNKKKVNKWHKGAKTSFNPNAGYCIKAEGKNIIPNKYKDLQYAESVIDAYHNAVIVEHWERIEKRNNRGFALDIENSTIQDYVLPIGELENETEW